MKGKRVRSSMNKYKCGRWRRMEEERDIISVSSLQYSLSRLMIYRDDKKPLKKSM